jgi:hypothetical protein
MDGLAFCEVDADELSLNPAAHAHHVVGDEGADAGQLWFLEATDWNSGNPCDSLLTRGCRKLNFYDHREASGGSIMANPAGQSIEPCFLRCCLREKTGRIFRRLLGPACVPFGFLASPSFMPVSPAYTNDSHGNETSRTLAYGTAIARTVTTVWHPTFRLPSDNPLKRLLTALSYRVGGDGRSSAHQSRSF